MEEKTLGDYKKFATMLFGEDSESVKWVERHIDINPKKEEGIVIQSEEQMLIAMSHIHENKTQGNLRIPVK